MSSNESGKYSVLNPAVFYMIQRRQRVFRDIIGKIEKPMDDIKFLEVGCGHGQFLIEFQAFGIREENIAGIDIDEKRVESSRKRVSNSDIRVAGVDKLPWADKSFDIVFQSTVFTSIPDPEIRKKGAAEMMRVCKDDGFILWYDFTFNNPANKNVRGIKKSEIRELFSGWNCEFTKITLAAPLARLLVPFSRNLTSAVETFCPFLRTHVVAKISK